MKKKILCTAGILLAGLLAGCAGKGETATTVANSNAQSGTEAGQGSTDNTEGTEARDNAQKKVITIGASPSPHAEILKEAAKLLADRGYELDIVEYTDYVQPNNALESGDLDVNYFQHIPYLDEFNTQYGTSIVSLAAIHYEPLGIYEGKTKSLEELAEGAKIAVPNDVTNEARALLLLADQGLITLKEDAGLTATKNDILDNPKKIEILELEAAQIPRAIQDVDLAVVNGNYALEAGFQVKDALAIEGETSLAAQTYANILAVKKGNESEEGLLALVDVLQSEEIRKFIEDNYEGAVVPIF